jgi:outer membrane protein
MTTRLIRNAIVLAMLSVAAQPIVASAAQGDWIFRAGVGNVDPKSDNGTLPASLPAPLGGAELDVDSATSATFEIAYMFADRWGVELFAPYVFNHDVGATGSSGDIAEVDLWPPVLSLQYHFNPDGRFRPYVGAGLNYSTFSRDKGKGPLSGVDLDLDDSFGFAAQLGADIGLGNNWLLNLGVRWIDLDSDVEVNGTEITKAEIDPFIYQAQVGYRFGRPAAVVAAAAAPAAVAPPRPAPPPPPAPRDSDGDGIADDLDQCPDTPRGERVGPQGCTCDVTRQLQFAFNSAELTAEDKTILDEVAENLIRLKFISGTVIGHTDSTGPEDFNQRLSERRAQSVADYLQDRGVAPGRLAVSGKGESEPIADNATREGRAQNRRVVLRRTDCDQR